MSPRSTTCSAGQPKLRGARRPRSWQLRRSRTRTRRARRAPWRDPPLTSQFTVFSVFTTRASGNARWICSPRLSKLETNRPGGMRSGRADSRRRRAPSRRGPPCAPSRSPRARPSPAVQLKTTSPWAAASANVPWLAPSRPTRSTRPPFVVRSAGAHHHLVAQLDESRADRVADHARSQHTDPHLSSFVVQRRPV